MCKIENLKVVSIGNVFDCNNFNDNDIDVLLSCKLNLTEEELYDSEDYGSDGTPFISVSLDKRDVDSLAVILSDCYNDMGYTFTNSQIKDIKNKVVCYLNKN